MKKTKCSKCGNYFNVDKLTNISLCNGQCWTNICQTCTIIVDQEILDIFENNTEITGYYVVTDETRLEDLEQFGTRSKISRRWIIKELLPEHKDLQKQLDNFGM